ncbi:MAG: helix-turn-helix transcriptional regulator [Saprospiraceae bacterium]|nr:helix-turn-helix transcriptional regulator [Saprospiraceae bacterium]
MKNKVKVYRAMNNISQEELAQALGVSRQSIYAIETSKYIPSTLLALKMASYFLCSVEELFEVEEGD